MLSERFRNAPRGPCDGTQKRFLFVFQAREPEGSTSSDTMSVSLERR